jgi:hypothetical protein
MLWSEVVVRKPRSNESFFNVDARYKGREGVVLIVREQLSRATRL